MAVGLKIAPLGPTVLTGGMFVQLEALDPVTGLEVANVQIQSIAIYGTGEGGGGQVVELPVFLLPGGDVVS
jgi:hypothetical protein